MSDLKKILVSIPKSYDEQLAKYSKKFDKSKSELVRNAIEMYLGKIKLEALNQSLKEGYIQMSEINLTLAEMYFESDIKAFSDYEEKLSESEACEC